MPNFGVCQLRNPWVDFQKNLQGWLRRGPHPIRKYWGQSVQRGRVCACVKLSPSGVYFFLFLGSIIPCASLQVGSLDRSSSLAAQMTRPGDHYVLFMVSLIRKIFFPIFCPKMWKIALRPMANSKGYNSETVKDRRELFSPNRGFSGSRNRMVSFKFTPDWPLLPWQPIVVISTQNWP